MWLDEVVIRTLTNRRREIDTRSNTIMGRSLPRWNDILLNALNFLWAKALFSGISAEIAGECLVRGVMRE